MRRTQAHKTGNARAIIAESGGDGYAAAAALVGADEADSILADYWRALKVECGEPVNMIEIEAAVAKVRREAGY